MEKSASSTREIIVQNYKNGSMMWRLSIATMNESDPLPSFVRIDRSIAFWEESSLRLNLK